MFSSKKIMMSSHSASSSCSYCSFSGKYNNLSSRFNSSEMPWWTGSAGLAAAAAYDYRDMVLGGRAPSSSEDFIFAYRTRVVETFSDFPPYSAITYTVVDGYRIYQDGIIKPSAISVDGQCKNSPCESLPGGGQVSVGQFSDYLWAFCCS